MTLCPRGDAVVKWVTGMLVAAAASGCGVVLGIEDLSSADPSRPGVDPVKPILDPPRAPWGYSFGTSASERVDDIDVLRDSIVVTGSCGCTLGADGEVRADAALDNPLLLGVSKSGDHLFTRPLDTTLSAPSRLRVANDGSDMILAGAFTGGFQAAGGLQSDLADGFVAKSGGGSGDILWTRQLAGTGNQRAFDVVAVSGRAHVVGGFDHELAVDGQSFGATAYESMFVARIHEAYGDVELIRAFQGSGSLSGRRIAASESGDVVVAGLHDGDFGLIGAGSAVGRGMFAAMLDAEGDPKWLVSSAGDPDQIHVAAVAIGPDSSVVLAGDFLGPLDFGERYDAHDAADGFIVKLDANGKHLWTRVLSGRGSGGAQFCRDLRVDDEGNVIVVGDFTLTMYIGDEAHFADGTDGFVAELAPDGAVRWTQQLGGPGLQSASALTRDDDALLVAGQFDGTLFLADGELVSQGREDIFIVRLDRPAP